MPAGESSFRASANCSHRLRTRARAGTDLRTRTEQAIDVVLFLPHHTVGHQTADSGCCSKATRPVWLQMGQLILALVVERGRKKKVDDVKALLEGKKTIPF